MHSSNLSQIAFPNVQLLVLILYHIPQNFPISSNFFIVLEYRK